jgi:acetoin utilization deacetylase AcuC-like enzyme
VTVHIVDHRDFELHAPGPGHVERPERVAAVAKALRDPALGVELTWHEAPPATEADLECLHPRAHIDRVHAVCLCGGGYLDGDTAVNDKSWDAALRAVGAGLLGVELALDGRGNVFAPVRPPGHHAEEAQAMGFCLFGNVALAAMSALDRVERVLVVDWDVHHGNGTQALVENEPRIRFISMHQWPLYPGTGGAGERGVGNVWNVPRPAGLPAADYVRDLIAAIDEATHGWPPQLVLISAGFDAMRGDPLAGFTLDADDYRPIVARLRRDGAPVVALLEGGYDLANLEAGVRVLVRALA